MNLADFFDLTWIEWTIIIVLLVSFVVQTLFYFLIYKKPYSYEQQRTKNIQSEDAETNFPPISVIIASRNESENLEKNLPLILGQDYPDFEVVVVNSGSTDETDTVLKRLQNQHPHLYHTYIPSGAEQFNEKKLALTVGIKASKNNHLVLTEAYCNPVSNTWLKEYAREFASGKQVVLGFCRLNIPKNVAMRRFMLYDNLIHSLKYLSLAILKKPFMGIGRNLGFTQELFFQHKGYSSILNMDGGDDDLLINKIATPQNTATLLSPTSFTETDVVESFGIWRSLKSKYLYTKKFYRGRGASLFGWETFSKYLFYIGTASSITFGILYQKYLLIGLPALLFIIRYAYQWVIINRNSTLLQSGSYHLLLLFFDLFQPFNNFRFKRYITKRNKYSRR